MQAFGPAGFGLPAVLVGGVLVIALALLILHLLFPAAQKKRPRGVVFSRMARLCPRCRQELTETERNGLQIEVCPDCQGVWLSQGKLDQIMR